MASISNSRSYTFDKCPQQYDYKYRKNIKPLARNLHFDSWERLQRGILGHKGLEYGFLAQAVYDGVQSHVDMLQKEDISEEQKEALPVMAQDATAAASAALAWLPVADWEPVIHKGKPMVEAELRIPIAGWEGFLGYADLVARHKPTGRVLVIDYKFRERFGAAGEDIYNTQFALYQYALAQIGVPVDGSLIFEIKPRPAVRASKIVREDIGGIDSERVSADGRFRTTPTYRSNEYLENIWRDFERKALVIANVTDSGIYRNLNAFNCGFCPYQKLCQAELRGEDAAYVLKTQYTGPGSLRIVDEPT